MVVNLTANQVKWAVYWINQFIFYFFIM